MPVEPHSFRDVMGAFATGVTIVTSASGDERAGMTVNSLTSVSLDPVLVLVCLEHGTPTERLIRRSGRFAVGILGDHAKHISALFADPDLAGWPHEVESLEIGGLPVVGGLGHLICRVDEIFDKGDHAIVVGSVEECGAKDGAPLLYFRGSYRRLVN